ncbi:MAG TPA: HAD-IA family hydrolase [Candidatus Baltobacteraceae bacterium]|nr:HAD-IA family hydrolase [Candidatus Baltobacteraceae bacterium]
MSTTRILTCRAVLFDLDGVLADSRRVVEGVWKEWGKLRGIDPAPFLAIAHGRRTSEILRAVAPHLDIAAETYALDRMEEFGTEGLVPIPGVRDFIGRLPRDRWAVVTSGHRECAEFRLRYVGIPFPRVFITGDLVQRGKPNPEGYLTAAQRLGFPPADCVVFEDAPPGVAAAKAAGMRVVGVLTTHAPRSLTHTFLQIVDFRSRLLRLRIA